MSDKFDLIRSPWSESLLELGRLADSKLVLVSPFIGAGPLEDLYSSLNLDSPPEIEILTNLAVDSLLHGTVDATAIAGFCRRLPSVSVWNLPSLHAKAYIANNQMAIVTSGNLTSASLTKSYEYGVKISDPNTIREILADIREYASLGSKLSLSELDKYAEIASRLQQKYRTALRSVGSKAVEEFQTELESAKEELLNLRDNGGRSENAIFAKTILHVLKSGPLPTRLIHPMIQSIQPDLCDDSVFRVIDGNRYGRRWKHCVRSAQQHLKRRKEIKLVAGNWQLT